MYKYLQLLFFLAIILLFVGCKTSRNEYFDHYGKVTEYRSEVSLLEEEKIEQLKGIIYSVNKVLESDDSNTLFIAKKLNDEAFLLLGLPKKSEIQKWNDIVNSYIEEQDIKKGDKLFSKQIDFNYKLEKKLERLSTKIKAEKEILELINIQNAKKAEKWDKHVSEKWWKRFWKWATGSIGLVGVIAFMVLCPSLAIPLFTSIIRFIVTMIPQLASLLGVVGKNLVDNISKAIGKTRNTLKDIERFEPQKTFTAKEVRELLDNNLKDATDKSDKKYIEHIRKKMNL